MGKILAQSFFRRPAKAVAEELLGKFLVRSYRGAEISGMITEVEVYDGFEDRASHASRGKTPRNSPMFEKGGVWYIYFTYGMHWMLNIVVGAKDYPSAILIRGTDVISGPARLTKFFKIDGKLNTLRASPNGYTRQGGSPKAGLWIEERGAAVSKKNIVKMPRIGVAYAGLLWSQKKWRFLLRIRITKTREKEN